MRILTVGHSTRSSADFVALLKTHGVTLVADVRRYPGSRRNPQFGRDRLRETLQAAGISYEHLEELGGMREATPDSSNTGLAEPFRGYADHMATAAFDGGVTRLLKRAAEGTVVVMCAEADPAKCHRSLLADALTVRGVDVEHIADLDRMPHEPRYTGVVDGVPRYKAPDQPALPF